MKGDKITDKYPVTGSERKLTILYMDGEAFLPGITNTLPEQSREFEITICRNAEEATEFLLKQPFDAIISDVRLTECDCLNLLRKIREKGDNTPFIVFTGKGHEDVVIEALNSGADYYIQKKGDPKAEFSELSDRIISEVYKRRNETLIKSFFYSHSDLMFVKDEKLRYIITNDAVQNFFGRSKEEMLYKTDSELINSDSAKKCLESDEKALKTGKKVISEEISGDRIFETIKFPLEIADEKTGVGGVIRDITDRIQAVKSLREIESLNQHIIDAIPDILIRCRRDGTLVDIRAPDESLLLAHRSESIGKTVTDVTPSDLGLFLMKSIRSALDSKRMERVEYSFPHRGGLSYHEARIIPYLEDEVIALIRDITSQREAEEGLKQKNEELAAAEEESRQQLDEIMQAQKMLEENEAYIRTVLDNIPVGIAVNSVSPEVNFEYFNENFLNYYHITADELKSPDSFWDIVYEDPVFREELKGRILKDSEAGDPDRMHWEDIPITRFGGETTFINARNIPLPKKGLVISMVWDVTENKKIQDEVEHEKELFLRTFESLQDAAFVIDSYPGYIQAVNEAAISVFGYNRKEMTGRSTDFLHVDNASLESFHRHISPYLKRHEPVPHFEFLMKRKDGTSFPTEHSITPLYDSAGTLTGRVSIVRDISERKEMENRERTALNQIEDNLEQLASLNDQIRNPLAVIAGIVDLKCPQSSEPIFEQVKKIDDIISMLDAGWVRSEKVWEFLKGHYGIGIEKIENKTEEK